MMLDAKCDFQFLKPIVETVATMDKARVFRIKTFEQEILDAEFQ